MVSLFVSAKLFLVTVVIQLHLNKLKVIGLPFFAMAVWLMDYKGYLPQLIKCHRATVNDFHFSLVPFYICEP